MQGWKRMRKLGYWLGGAVVAYAVLGFLVVPPIVRGQLESRLTELLGRKVEVERVRFNPFTLAASVHGFRLKEPDGAADAAGFDELRVNATWSSLLQLGVVLESVQLAQPYVRMARLADGKSSFQDIVDRFAGAPSQPAAEASGPARFAVYNISLSGGRVDFDDRPEKTQHVVSDIQIGLPFISSLPREVDIVVQPRLAAKVNGTPFEITGETTPFKDASTTTLRIDIDDLEVAKYLEYVPVALRVRVPSGRLTTRLVITSAVAREQMQTLAVSGTASLQRLVVQDAGGGALASLGRLSVDLESLDLLKRRAAIKAIRIESPEIDIVRQKDGSLNLTNAFPPAPGAKPEAQSKEPPFAVAIADVALLGGQVRFVDRTTAKPVQMSLNDLALSIAGLSSAPDSRADLKLTGRVNRTAPIEAAGKVNLLSPNLWADLQASIQGIDLVPMSPYSGMYAGYAIDKGKLSLKHAYTIQDRKLSGKNAIHLDQFTFGQKIDSPTATNLPVALAISLLKDRNGVIKLDLPIEASFDDPKAGRGQILKQETEELLGKAASSPFALLGEQVGGGAELAYLEFAAGSAALDAAAEGKLRTLAKALYERPGLKLDVGGRVDEEKDGAEIKRAAAERQAKAAKKDEKAAEPAVKPEDLQLLAQARAQAARDWLVGSGKLPAERVAVTETKLGATRVEFTLR